MKELVMNYNSNKCLIYIENSFDELEGLIKGNSSNTIIFSEDSISDFFSKIIDNDSIFLYSCTEDNIQIADIKEYIDKHSDKSSIEYVVAGSDSYIRFITNVLKEINKDYYIFLIIPSSLKAIDGVLLTNNMTNNIYINISLLSAIDDANFFSGFAYIMRDALIKDAVFYSWLIDNMYEICERDLDTLSYIVEKSISIKNIILTTAKSDNINNTALSIGNVFSESIYDYMNGTMKKGECLSLALVAIAYISWKKNWLNKDEYYEIRDMFVPFYLPISIEMIDIDRLVNMICDRLGSNDSCYELFLLKKVGKSLIDTTITVDDIRSSIEEINFDEAW